MLQREAVSSVTEPYQLLTASPLSVASDEWPQCAACPGMHRLQIAAFLQAFQWDFYKFIFLHQAPFTELCQEWINQAGELQRVILSLGLPCDRSSATWLLLPLQLVAVCSKIFGTLGPVSWSTCICYIFGICYCIFMLPVDFSISVIVEKQPTLQGARSYL